MIPQLMHLRSKKSFLPTVLTHEYYGYTTRLISKNLLSNKAGTNSAEIKTTIHFVNTEKVTGHDLIPAKVVNMSADVINIHIANIIVKDIRQSSYSKNGNTVSVRPIFKKRCSNKNKKTINQ